MIDERSVDRLSGFRVGDPVVVLYEGLYNGHPGRFLGLRPDADWANIEERNGTICSYPVRWLRPAEDVPDLANRRATATATK